ncbi:hypothetical protein LTR67_004280 [Exophiala xenobiotica]
MARRIDDPDNLNAFLRLIHGTPLSASPNARLAAVAQTLLPTATLNDTRDQTEPEPEHVETTTAPDSTAPSVEASPAAGSRAPPPTPETSLNNVDKIAPLDPIWEDDGDGISEERGTPVQAPAQPTPPVRYSPEKMATPPSRATPSRSILGEMPTNLTPTQRRLLVKCRTDIDEQDKMRIIQQMQSQAQNYMEETVERFRQTKEAMFAQAQEQAAAKALYNIEVKQAGGQASALSALARPFPPIPDFPADFQEAPVTPASVGGVQLWETDTPVAPAEDSSFTVASTPPVEKLVPETMTKEQPDSGDNLTPAPKGDNNDSPFKGATSPTIVVTASTDTGGSIRGADSCEEEETHSEGQDVDTGDESGDEAREHRTHFKSWGAPTTRNKPKSRIRKVILTGLPATADLTLVQTLIHGGIVESMRLSPAGPESTTANAYVVFTSADACDKYYDRYPNGFDVRFQGKKYAVLVNKGEDVDVISGMMQGYIDCGATRVIKVSQVDEEWGIVALNKLAEGKNKVRQVETVLDAYRNGERTIHFRFANIPDAVRFKGILIRSFNWEGCSVDFAEDPCSKATGIHYD